MLLKLYQTGQPVLREHARSVSKKLLESKKIQDLIDFMINTLRDAPGVGLAAPQVGEPLQIMVIEDKAKYHEQVPKDVLKAQNRKPIAVEVLVNPKLKVLEPKKEYWFEGCLSVDGYLAVVPRAKIVSIEALDRHGKPISYKANGWHARILQHELDHLNGALFIDRMNSKSFMGVKNFNLEWRKALQPEIKKKFVNL